MRVGSKLYAWDVLRGYGQPAECSWHRVRSNGEYEIVQRTSKSDQLTRLLKDARAKAKEQVQQDVETLVAVKREAQEKLEAEPTPKHQPHSRRHNRQLQEDMADRKHENFPERLLRNKYGVRVYSHGDKFSFDLCVNNADQNDFPGCRTVRMLVQGRKVRYTLNRDRMMAMAKEVTRRLTPQEWKELMEWGNLLSSPQKAVRKA